MSIFEIFQKNVLSTPNKVAINFKNTQTTYLELADKVLALNKYFVSVGLKQGDSIALFLNNSLDYPIIFLAASRMGLILVPLPMTLKGEAQSKALKIANIKLIFAWHSLSKALHEKYQALVVSVGKVVQDLDSLNDIYSKFEKQELEQAIALNIDIDKPYILTMTSGSTGEPKPITLSQRTKINRSLLATKEHYNLSSQDIILTSTPLYHSLAQRCVLLPLLIGGTAVILDKYTPLKWLQTIDKFKVSFLFAVSNQLTSILKLSKSELHELKFTALKTIVSSSASLKPNAKLELTKIFDCDFYDCYGTSEIGVASDFSFAKNPDKMASVGQPLPFVEIQILDESLTPLSYNQAGQIAVKTQTAFSGYYQKDDLTKKAYLNDEYFLTGDIGKLDQDNFLYFLDRKKDVIIVGGVNVYPKDIEKVIKDHGAISECVAIGVEDEHLGEKVLLVIEGEPEGIDLVQIKKACLSHLADYQLPAAFEFTPKIPRTALGKIQRNKVKSLFKNYQFQSLIR